MNEESDSEEVSHSSVNRIWPYFLLAFISAALYAQSTAYQFVWDDDYFVVQNTAIRSWRNVPKFFTDASTYSNGLWTGMYRPFRNVSYLIDYSTAGLNPIIFHLHNVLLHVVNVCLVFALVSKLQEMIWSRQSRSASRISPAFIAAGIWALLPVHTESVAWVKSRDELLFTGWYLAALLACLQLLASQGRRRLWTMLALGCFAASLLSKEMAISFPLILLLFFAYLPSRQQVFRRMLPVLAGSFCLCVAFFVARHLVLGRTSQQDYISGNLYHELLTTTTAFGRYIRLTLLPGQLISDYSGYPIVRTPLNLRFLRAATALLVLVGLAVLTRRRLPLVSMGTLWWFITLAPVSNVVPTMQFLAERFLYLPLVGFALACAGMLAAVQTYWTTRSNENTPIRRHLPLIAAACYALALGCATLFALPAWRSNATLHDAMFAHTPPSNRVNMNHLTYLVNAGRFDEALPLAKQMAASRETGYSEADNPLLERVIGITLVQSGSTTEGLTHLQHSLELLPHDAGALGAMGTYYGMQGDHRRALSYFERAHALNPTDAQISRNLEIARRSSEAGQPRSR